MLGHIVAAQFDLERILGDLIRSGAPTSMARDQITALSQLGRQIGGADAMALAGFAQQVASAVAQSGIIAQESRAVAADAVASDALNLSNIARASRQQVGDIMRDMNRFDSYLHFASPNDEAEYRKREADRRAYIDAERAKGTPAGDLNAAGGAIGQMADAKAHGAGDSPEFKQRWSSLVAGTQNLRAEILRTGGDVSKFDTRLREDFREILKSKGMTDAEIDARFAAYPSNPLEAVRAFVDADDLRKIGAGQEVQTTVPTAKLSPQPAAMTAADAMATLIAAGVTMTDPDAQSSPAHGVTAGVTPSVPRATVRT